MSPRSGVGIDQGLRVFARGAANLRRRYGMNGCWVAPVPGQQLVETSDRMVGDAGDEIGQPGLRIDIVELGGHDQAEGGALTASVGAGDASLPRQAAPARGIIGQARRRPRRDSLRRSSRMHASSPVTNGAPAPDEQPALLDLLCFGQPTA